ncbi:MAG: transglutaminase domain-containing protein, partial [Halobacteriales archaeon]|nr:transglutaminase domain-containing protein [Halobacteriales archaeon]
MRFRPILPVAILVLSGLSGCADVLDRIGSPDYDVSVTPLAEGSDAWNRDSSFRVVVAQNATVRIVASQGEREVVKEAFKDATITIPDGTWTVTYWIDGHKWHSYDTVRIDTTPPAFKGLETVADATDGNYVLGQGASVQDAAALSVVELRTRKVVGHSLPVQLSGLPNGLQAYLVSAHDAAGNYANVTVQVHVGPAADLPDGRFSFGVVARYTNQARLWDISHPEEYLSISDARNEVGGDFLGAGFGVTPDDAAVQEVVQGQVSPDMDTMQAALALYRWFADNLEYDETRLDSDTLLTPHQVLRDTEDAAGKSTHTAGLVDDGAGNGVRGGICRDLAATFVSLLRASGIPARLVSGYVAGTVNGFHAWVEFYAGAVHGQSPWVPVDVSTIDGPFRDAVLLQSFGLELPEYLPLRYVPAAGEAEGWSTALSVHYTWPQGSGQQAPDIQFRKELATDFTYEGVLCFNPDTHARILADDRGACGGAFGFYLDHFIRQTERTIDY